MKYNKNELVLGLDIGITSVGWALVDDSTNNLVEFGVRRFDQATAANEARVNRSARRTNRRKNWRKQQIKNAFNDFNIIKNEEITKKGYSDFTATHKSKTLDQSLSQISEKTVYHLRNKALTEKVSIRELFISIYNIAKTRGHFLLEEVDFENGELSISLIIERIVDFLKTYIVFQNDKIDDFQKLVLNEMIINNNFKQKDLKTLLKVIYVDVETDEKANDKLLDLLNLLGGWKSNLSNVDDSLKEKSRNIIEIKNDAEATEFEIEAANIYDMIQTYKILKGGYNYLCQKHVEILDKFESFGEITPEKLNEDSKLEDFFKAYRAKMNVKGKGSMKLKVIKNVENNYPNGLYLKEVNDILKNQQQYYKQITDEFIEIIKSIIKARIPYYMGVLSKDGKNSWIERNSEKVKYSYEYALKNQQIFDEETSIKRWKLNMISNCTYLLEEKALAKNSILLELFTILNDLNIYKAESNGDTFNISKFDKIKVINDVFLKKRSVQFIEISECLGYEFFGSIKNKAIKKFNKCFTAYHDITSIIPELKIDNIEDELKEINSNNSKLMQIENIIETLVLYDDPQNKNNILSKTYGKEQCEKLSKLNYKDFGSLSKKIIYNYPLNKNGETMIERLLNEEVEQMTIFSTATNALGENIDISSNKYYSKLEIKNKLSSHLLIEQNKPTIPMSRVVVRGINETFKVFNQICEQFGTPKKIVIETAKELGDFKVQKENYAAFFGETKKLHEFLLKQNKENKINSDVEEWNELEQYLATNKKKIELYIRQDGKCLLTGNPININNLINYQIDHILPKGFGDNSMNNLMLIEGAVNNLKNNNLPLEYIRSTDNIALEIQYKERVQSLYKRKLISEDKYNRLLLENQSEAFGFIQRNLVDTRYIIREITAIFKAYNEYNNLGYETISLQGSYNAIYRNALNFRKNRDLGDQHHAHDAAIIIIVDKCLNTLLPNYSKGNKFNAERYNKFVNDYLQNINVSSLRIKRTIENMYEIAFNEKYNDKNSLIEQCKSKVPLISWKVDKKYTGKLFNATIISSDKFLREVNTVKSVAKEVGLNKTISYEQIIKEIGKTEYNKIALKNDSKVLSIIDVNDMKKRFGSVECVAVDVYKLTVDKKKNKKKFFAVHIPKAIIDENGQIKKEKYIKLIKRHYKYKELFDENDNLIEGAFKIRLFRNDLYYDTDRNEIKLFNIGSMQKKVIEVKNIQMYAYNSLYNIVNELDNKTKIKGMWIDQSQLAQIIENEYQCAFDKGIDLRDAKEFITSYSGINKSEKINKYLLFELLALCYMENQLKIIPAKINGRNIQTINNISNKDAQYVKIVNSILGIRFEMTNEKLIINGKHTKIKNDKLTWSI